LGGQFLSPDVIAGIPGMCFATPVEIHPMSDRNVAMQAMSAERIARHIAIVMMSVTRMIIYAKIPIIYIAMSDMSVVRTVMIGAMP
jgi:hypothetical protein